MTEEEKNKKSYAKYVCPKCKTRNSIVNNQASDGYHMKCLTCGIMWFWDIVHNRTWRAKD